MDEAAVRNTRDVDIVLRRADLPAAAAALAGAGFIHRRVASLGQPGGLERFLDGSGASPRDALQVVLAGEKVRPDSPLPAPDVTESGPGGGFSLLNQEALVVMKLSAYRDKDRPHLRDLIELGLVDETWPGRVPPAVRGRLEALLRNPE